MSAVHSNTKGKVLGILFGGEDLHFGILDGDNKLCISRLLTPITKQVHVLAYIDLVLWNVTKDCNILPNGDQNSPPQEMSEVAANEYTTFKFEDLVRIM